MLSSLLASSLDPIKIALSFLLVLRPDRWVGFLRIVTVSLIAIYIVFGYLFGNVSINTYWIAVHVFSIVFLSGIWFVLTKLFGRRVAVVTAASAAVLAVAMIAVAVSNPRAASCIGAACLPTSTQPPVDVVSQVGSSVPATAFIERDEAPAPVWGAEAKIGKLAPVEADTIVTSGHVGYGSKIIAEENEIYYKANKYSMDWLIVGALVDFGRNAVREFVYGGNVSVDFINSVQRATQSGDNDPLWRSDQKRNFIQRNNADIPPDQQWRYYATGNMIQAQMLLREAKAYREARRISGQYGGL